MASLRALQQPAPLALDFLHLAYGSDSGLLTARWLRPVSAAEFRQGYTATLAAAEAVSCPVWLIDLGSRTTPNPAETDWFSQDFLPQLPARLGGHVYVGLLLPAHFVVPAGPPHLAASAAISPAPGLMVRIFTNENRLREWLANCQRSVPRRRLPTMLPVWPYWYGV